MFSKTKSEVKQEDLKIKLNDEEVITPVNQHKILGWNINNRLSMDQHINKTIQAATLKMNEICKYTKYMSLKTRTKVFKAHVLSLFQYGIEQYCGEVGSIKQKLHTAIMSASRRIRGFRYQRETNASVLEDLNMEEPNQIVLKATLRYIHKVVFTRTPREVKQLIKTPRYRSTGDIKPVHFPRTAKFARNTINEGIKLYNAIEPEIRKPNP